MIAPIRRVNWCFFLCAITVDDAVHQPFAFPFASPAHYPTAMTELLLLLAGFVGGVLNSLAGGGSFIVFPALLAAGVPPVIANASNTYAAMPGYVSGVVGFWPAMKEHRGQLVLYTVISMVFGYLGAELLLHVSSRTFELAVPWLLLFAMTLFIFGARINTWLVGHWPPRARFAGLIILLAAVCFYSGFFNAGGGILLLAALTLSGITNMLALNGLKLWCAAAGAVTAVIRFIVAGSIEWYHGTIALIGVTTGAYLAARLARFIPQPMLRALVIVYGVGLTIWFYYSTYVSGSSA